MTDKKTLRAQIKNITPEDRAFKDALINCFLYESDIYRDADEIFLFYGFCQEPDLRALAMNALLDGKAVAYPVTVTDRDMVFRYISDFEKDFFPGSFGTLEPRDSLPEADYSKNANRIIICPGLAFDIDGRRLGHGNGYYDYFLEGHAQYFSTVSGVCYSDYIVPKVPTDGYDYVMDHILTEQEWFK